MREAERKNLQKLCEAMVHGDGRVPGLGDLVANLESKGQVPTRIMGVLIRFGQIRENLQLLAEAGGDTRDMRKSQIIVANRLGALMRRQEGEIRLALESEALETSRRLNMLIEKEPSGGAVRKTWFPLGGSAELEDFLRELDSAEYLRSALSYIDFNAHIAPWEYFSREHSPKIKFIVKEARRRDFQDSGFHPKRFWWRQPVRWETEEEGAEPVHRTYRGRATTEALAVIAFIGVIFAIAGFATLRSGWAASIPVCTVTIILAAIASFILLSWHFKEVVVGSRKIEYWVGRRKRFEAAWKDVVSVGIWRAIRHQSAYDRDSWGLAYDDDLFDMRWGRPRTAVELGLDVLDDALDLAVEYQRDNAYERADYGIHIRTLKGDLKLKSGWGFTSWTVQNIFDAIKRVQGSYPHIKMIDTRRWRRPW